MRKGKGRERKGIWKGNRKGKVTGTGRTRRDACVAVMLIYQQ